MVQKQPSSILMEKTEIPKLKNALEDKYKKLNDDQHQKEVDSYERLKNKRNK